ncbi:Protein SPIRRIG [Senna tora]|uniref:Protein SPIRRIG n=1 Tax=Senna tora TaxID=362788 RepID=A0A834SHV6_9FABA|nr:Protein SPIRRIG [Senna tora]
MNPASSKKSTPNFGGRLNGHVYYSMVCLFQAIGTAKEINKTGIMLWPGLQLIFIVPQRAYMSTSELAMDPSRKKPFLIRNPWISLPFFSADKLAAAESMLTKATESSCTPDSFSDLALSRSLHFAYMEISALEMNTISPYPLFMVIPWISAPKRGSLRAPQALSTQGKTRSLVRPVSFRDQLSWLTYFFVSSQSENVLLVTERIESEGSCDVLIMARQSPLMLQTARRIPAAVTISPVKSLTKIAETGAGNFGSCRTNTIELRSHIITEQSSDPLTTSIILSLKVTICMIDEELLRTSSGSVTESISTLPSYVSGNPLVYQAGEMFLDWTNPDFHSHNLQGPKERLDIGSEEDGLGDPRSDLSCTATGTDTALDLAPISSAEWRNKQLDIKIILFTTISQTLKISLQRSSFLRIRYGPSIGQSCHSGSSETQDLLSGNIPHS